VDLVLEAAFGGAAPSGVVLICGTGSIALARDAGGALVRAGGEGPERGDAGGGGWIGRRAIEAGIVAPPAGAGPPAGLVPAVLAAVRSGDGAARGVVADAARELAALARRAAASARLGAPFEVRMAGGVAVNSPELVDLVARELASGTPAGSVGPLVREPVLGALALATRALARGGDVPPGW
jgi:N-acetylglucosamine kinase-like BadF-type ATPase